MKDEKIAAYLRVLPPQKPTSGISVAKMMGLIETRYGDLANINQDGGDIEGDKISFLIRSGVGTLEGVIFPDVFQVDIIEPTNYNYAFRFILWLREVFPPKQRLAVYNEYILEQIIELTHETTEDDLADIFGTAAI